MSVMAYMPYGASGIIIRVEADIRRGIPGIDITGLAEGAVRESRERVRAAFRNSGFKFPADRILINLAPAGLRKGGSALDLPIALSVMAATGLVPIAGDILVMGELELSGRIRPVTGVLAAIAAGLDAGIADFIVPAENAREAAILGAPIGHSQSSRPAARFASAASLEEAVHALFVREEDGDFPAYAGGISLTSETTSAPNGAAFTVGEDFADARGQSVYKRALEIAAAGGHNVLAFGPPGAGKTMLARRLPSIMPPLTPDEAVEVTRLYSLARTSEEFIEGLITHPPFRAPHHSASAEGILGGGRIPRPGEISLAHFGVLFLDEAPEFRTDVMQALREPLEDHVISIVRSERQIRLPAEFQLLLAANVCPCGRLGMRTGGDAAASVGNQHCFCSHNEIYRYWRKFSGALLDRIELRVPVLPPPTGVMTIGAGTTSPHADSTGTRGESSAEIARRVLAAVEIQRQRFAGTKIRRNALIPAGMIDTCCPLDAKAKNAFHAAAAKLCLSGRACHSIRRVARTIADLEGCEIIAAEHILEAVQHRLKGEDPLEILSMEE